MAQVGTHPAAPALAAVVERVAPGALRVLVADDNALNQNLLRRLVVKLGHNVDVVSNGREAVAAVAQQPYDAVLMDVLMPEMDGLEAAEAICRRWPRGTRPRLIALTALAGPGDQERCLKAGFDDYMIKPVHLEQLVRESVAHDPSVLARPLRVSVTELLQELCRAFDVREHEGHRSGRQRGAHPALP